MNATHFLRGALILAGTRCSNHDELGPYLEPYFGKHGFSLSGVKAGFKELCEQGSFAGRLTQAGAAHRAVRADVERAIALVEEDALESRILAEYPYQESLFKAREQAARAFAVIGLPMAVPELFIVQDFPGPYRGAQLRALTCDAGDAEQHGIEPGVYFLESRLSPFESKMILCHEMVHVFLGQRDPNLLARGLEEGIAEIIGNLFVMSQLFDESIAERVFKATRLRFPAPQTREVYWDFTRQAAFLCREFGRQGLVTLAAKGRQAIKDVEARLSRGELHDLGLDKNAGASSELDVVNRCCGTTPRSLVVSPLAFLLAPRAVQGTTVMEAIAGLHADIDEGRKAVQELQRRIGVAVLSEDETVIAWSDTDWLAGIGVIRYQLPT